MTAERTPPHDLGAERALLGSALLDPECWQAISEIVSAEDFYKDAHSVIFEALETLARTGGALDNVGLRGQLQLTQKLQRAGGDEYVLSLTDTIPTVSYALHNAKRVHDLSVVRAVINRNYELIARAYGELDDVGAFLDDAEDAVAKVCERRLGRAKVTMMSDAVEQSIESLVERAERGGGLLGYPSGYNTLDWTLSGFCPGDLIIVAGRPGMGKTALASDIVRGIVSRTSGLSALVFSIEMPNWQLAQRAIASEARYDLNLLRTARIRGENWKDLMQAAADLSALPIQLIDDAGITINDIARELRAHKRRNKDKRCAVVCIDYLQIMRTLSTKGSTRDQDLGAITQALKRLAKQEQVAILCLSQLNRGLENRQEKRPQLSDLRESGAIEQDADTILFVYRDEVYHEDSADKGLAEIIVGKQRNGSTGIYKYRFTREYTRFDNLQHEQEGST
jgi:replicative DNA helicase